MRPIEGLVSTHCKTNLQARGVAVTVGTSYKNKISCDRIGMIAASLRVGFYNVEKSLKWLTSSAFLPKKKPLHALRSQTSSHLAGMKFLHMGIFYPVWQDPCLQWMPESLQDGVETECSYIPCLKVSFIKVCLFI